MENEQYLVPVNTDRVAVMNLTADHRVTINGKPFTVLAEKLDGYKLAPEGSPHQSFDITHAHIADLEKKGKFEVTYGANKSENRYLDTLLNGKTLDDYSPAVRLKVRKEMKLISMYEKACLENGRISRKAPKFDDWLLKATADIHKRLRGDDAGEFQTLSTSQFNKKYKKFRDLGRNILALVPGHRGPGKKTVEWSPEALNFAVVEARAYLSPLEPTKVDVFDWYVAALGAENQGRDDNDKLYQFGKTKFYEIIDSFPAFDVMAARKGEAIARQFFAPNLRSYMDVRPGSLVQIDEWKGDMMTLVAKAGQLKTIPREYHKLLKKMRIWLVVAICVSTRMVLAVHAAAKPNAAAAIDTLRMIMSDKTRYSNIAGAANPWTARAKPEEMYMDNGSAFISEAFSTALQSLRINVGRPPAGKPTKRPHIESLFHAVGPKFTAFFHGKTFRNMIERGDYNPKDHASLVVSEFLAAFHLGICDIYSLKAHSSLGGRSPLNVWIDACHLYKYDPPPAPRQLMDAFGTLGTATIGSYGIEKHGVCYWNDRLIGQYKTQGKKPVKIKFDATNIYSLLAQNTDGDWYEVENKSGVPIGTTYRQWDDECKRRLRENEAETAKDAHIVHAAYDRLRKMGEEYAERAGLPPIEVPQEKLDLASAQVYTEYSQGTVSGLTRPTVGDVMDELRANPRLTKPTERNEPGESGRVTNDFDRRKDED